MGLPLSRRRALLVSAAILGIVAGSVIPTILYQRARSPAACLGNLLAQAEGTLPRDAVCPISRKAYIMGDVATCPDPDGHLESRPRLLCSKEGPWRLQQTLPPSSGRPVQLQKLLVDWKEHPGRATLLVQEPSPIRYIAAPLLCLFCAGAAVRFGLRARKGIAVAGNMAGVAIAAALGFASFMAVGESREWVLERADARLTRVTYAFGRELSRTTVAGCLGVVPTRSGNSHKLVVLHPPAADGSRMTSLGLVAGDRLDVADRLHRALLGP